MFLSAADEINDDRAPGTQPRNNSTTGFGGSLSGSDIIGDVKVDVIERIEETAKQQISIAALQSTSLYERVLSLVVSRNTTQF